MLGFQEFVDRDGPFFSEFPCMPGCSSKRCVSTLTFDFLLTCIVEESIDGFGVGGLPIHRLYRANMMKMVTMSVDGATRH